MRPGGRPGTTRHPGEYIAGRSPGGDPRVVVTAPGPGLVRVRGSGWVPAPGGTHRHDEGPRQAGAFAIRAEEGIRTPDLLITSELLYP